MTRYQWTVLLAAWLGWGFDAFDAVLFNYVAPNCIPTLLHLPLGSAAARVATSYWNGILTSLLLIGWALGGIAFGRMSDRLGRVRTMLFTILLYAVGTAACALATQVWMLIVFRFVASLGIGGEWAAGASMVAEVAPEHRRVEAGALLYTSAPFGLALATLVNFCVAGLWWPDSPAVSWRYVFLFGLMPAIVVFLVRSMVHEPERWQAAKGEGATAVAWHEIFSPRMRQLTLRGSLVAVIALTMWWSCNAFIPVVATGLARTAAQLHGLSESATLALVENWKLRGTLWYNFGGLIGTLLTVPIAKYLGRRPMYALYFALSAALLFITFGLDWPPETRLLLYFPIGIGVFGVFGSFTYYLPELFPTRLRASGAGFCYNVGRIIASVGPFLVGMAGARGLANEALFYIGFVPLLGFVFSPLILETRHQSLAD